MDIGDIDVFIGIDVGKSEHWATALSREGRKILDRALPNDEDRLREVYQRLGLPGVSRTVVDCVGQAALLLLTKSCSASPCVRYPSAE